MTHKECVEKAYKWLMNNGGVGFAFKELVSIDREIPDVIGFDSWQSILIECKVSRADFLRDKKKQHRSQGMGNWRFYCCPKGMIKADELPDRWGLIYIDEKGKVRLEYDCRKKRVPNPYREGEMMITIADENRFDADVRAERRIMYTALRRMHIKGHLQSIYDKGYLK